MRRDSSWWTAVHTGRAGNAMQSSSRWGAIKRSCRAYIHRVLHRLLSPAFRCTGIGVFDKMGQLPLPTVAVLKGGLSQEIRIWVRRGAGWDVFRPQLTGTVWRGGAGVLGYDLQWFLLHPQGCRQVDRLKMVRSWKLTVVSHIWQIKSGTLRISVADPDPVPFLPLDPGWVKNQDPNHGSGMNNHFFGLKYLNFLCGSGMENIRIRDKKHCLV